MAQGREVLGAGGVLTTKVQLLAPALADHLSSSPTESARANQELTHTVSSSAQLSGPSRGQSSVLRDFYTVSPHAGAVVLFFVAKLV